MARPLSASMSSLIRHLKTEVTAITAMEEDVPERDVSPHPLLSTAYY